ncbi:hypothetical protein [Pseudomonas extremaustralis]
MIHFPPLRTARFTAQLRELPIRDAIALAAMPEHRIEAAHSYFLRSAVIPDASMLDIDQWTVQERTLAVTHYMASTYDDGPNFTVCKVGDVETHYGDYLDGSASYPADDVEGIELEGDVWRVRQLTGRLACSAERLSGSLDGIDGFAYWQFALMAAQLVPNEEADSDLSDSDLDRLLLERMQVIAGFPESAFVRLLDAFEVGREQLHHLFSLGFDKAGIVVKARKESTAPAQCARFPARSTVTAVAKYLGGKPQESGA